LNELWSDRPIEIVIPNAVELHFGQGLLHHDLQRLDYDLGDWYTLTPKIKEDIEFYRRIIVKLKPGKSSVWKLSRLALFGPLKQILADLHNICRFSHF
jgi:hypothetical protein